MKNINRKLLIGLVWGIFFLWWLCSFLYENWYFRLYSLKSWYYLIYEFKHGWKISAVSDWIFVLTLFFALPIYLLGWSLCLKVKWLDLVKKIKVLVLKLFGKKSSVIKKRLKLGSKKAKLERPPMVNTPKLSKQEKSMQKLPSSAIKKEEIDFSTPTLNTEEIPKKTQSKAPDPPQNGPSFLMDDDIDENTPLSDIVLPERESVKENVTDILQQNGFKEVLKVPSKSVSFAAVSDDKIVLAYVDVEAGDWLADEEEFEGENPLWFSESFHRVSPVFELLKVAKQLRNALEEQSLSYKVQPYFIEKEGNIINAEDMIETWDELGVIVCRTDKGGDDELPTIVESFPKAKAPINDDDFEQVKKIIKEL